MPVVRAIGQQQTFHGMLLTADQNHITVTNTGVFTSAGIRYFFRQNVCALFSPKLRCPSIKVFISLNFNWKLILLVFMFTFYSFSLSLCPVTVHLLGNGILKWPYEVHYTQCWLLYYIGFLNWLASTPHCSFCLHLACYTRSWLQWPICICIDWAWS